MGLGWSELMKMRGTAYIKARTRNLRVQLRNNLIDDWRLSLLVAVAESEALTLRDERDAALAEVENLQALINDMYEEVWK